MEARPLAGGPNLLGQLLGAQHVERRVHQVAGQQHAFEQALQLRDGGFGRGIAHQRQGRERGRGAGFLIGLVALKLIGRQGQAFGQSQGSLRVFAQIMQKDLSGFLGFQQAVQGVAVAAQGFERAGGGRLFLRYYEVMLMREVIDGHQLVLPDQSRFHVATGRFG